MDIKQYTKDLLDKIDELSGEELEKLFTEALNEDPFKCLLCMMNPKCDFCPDECFKCFLDFME